MFKNKKKRLWELPILTILIGQVSILVNMLRDQSSCWRENRELFREHFIFTSLQFNLIEMMAA